MKIGTAEEVPHFRLRVEKGQKDRQECDAQRVNFSPLHFVCSLMRESLSPRFSEEQSFDTLVRTRYVPALIYAHLQPT